MIYDNIFYMGIKKTIKNLIEKIKSNKKIFFIILIVVLVAVSILIILMNFSMNKKTRIITDEYGYEIIVDENDKKIKNDWVEIGDYWYYVNDLSHIEKEKFIGDYYVGPKGIMLKNYWIKYNDKYYYASNTGKVIKNMLINIENDDYSFDENGALIVNNFYYDSIEKRLVYAGDSGKILKIDDFILINNNYYYIDDLGNILTNTWVNYDNEDYYLNENGIMLTNAYIDGFYIGSDGKKLKNTFAPDGSKLDENGNVIWDNTISKSLKNMKVGSFFTFGKYEQDNDTTNGKENIEWKILYKDDEKALLFSRYILDNIAFNEESVDTDWENSDIRQYLNKKFIDEAFEVEEKNLILDTLLKNEANDISKLSSGNDTVDKIFLLSLQEVNQFFGKASKDKTGFIVNKNLATKGTPYAQSQGLKVNDTETFAKGNSAFWLRTIGIAKDFACGVDSFGDVNNEGGNDLVSNKNGLRVALYVKIN